MSKFQHVPKYQQKPTQRFEPKKATGSARERFDLRRVARFERKTVEQVAELAAEHHIDGFDRKEKGFAGRSPGVRSNVKAPAGIRHAIDKIAGFSIVCV
jgi:hypothetical protein